MQESATSLPSEVGQLKNFLRAPKIMEGAENIHSSIVKQILRGLLSIIPEEVERSKFLESPKLQEVVSHLLQLQLALNDRLDFEGAIKPVPSELTVRAQAHERSIRKDLDQSIQCLDDPSVVLFLQKVVQSAVTETEYIEEQARKPHVLSGLEHSIEYRRSVNAVAMCAVCAAIFGKESLGDRMRLIEKSDVNDVKIQEKYAWVFGDRSETAVERAMQAMERLTTVHQIDDDWAGRHIDDRLGVPSIAIAAMREADFDETLAKKTLDRERGNYIQQARQIGLGFLPTHAATAGLQFLQDVNGFVTRVGNRHASVLKQLGLLDPLADLLPARESAYIKRDI